MQPTDLVGLGDDPALDFLNSTTTQGHLHVELLADGPSYLTWLELTGLLTASERGVAEEHFDRADLDAIAAEAVGLREWLRPVLRAWTSASPDRALSPKVTSRLNDVLRADRDYEQIATGGRALERHRHWEDARQLLVPPAAATARLLTTGDPDLVRHCEGLDCSLWFYDRTKAHRRRWCSMALCGNRAKARAHRQRQAD